MDGIQMIALSGEVYRVAETELQADKALKIKNLIDASEPNLAIKRAMDYASQGLWVVPKYLVDELLDWGNHFAIPIYKQSVERALIDQLNGNKQFAQF